MNVRSKVLPLPEMKSSHSGHTFCPQHGDRLCQNYWKSVSHKVHMTYFWVVGGGGRETEIEKELTTMFFTYNNTEDTDIP